MLEARDSKSNSSVETENQKETERECKREGWKSVGQVEGAVCYPSSKVSRLMSQLPAAHWISLSLWPTELFLASHTHPQAHKYICILTHRHSYTHAIRHPRFPLSTNRFKSQIARRKKKRLRDI